MSGVIVSQKRPRVLGWWHAGPLLFGDWGTSRLYVLGLAFAATGFAAPIYLVALSVLMIGVAWAYAHICSQFHEGGGVYTAARQISPLLSVIGATLLMADYIVTAALSLVDAFHYFGVSEAFIFGCCCGALALLGLINWLGARHAGTFALVIALVAMSLSAVIAVLSIPFIPGGLKAIDWGQQPVWSRWTSFVSIILALSGVEAVANMTGIMREPVERTSRRTIWPVLIEVVVLNMVFILGVVGVQAAIAAGTLAAQHTDEELKNAAMKVLAIESGQHWLGEHAGWWLGKTAAFAFGLLLVSAANTVIVDMIGVLYSLGRDRELPQKLTRLNYSGVPWIPLLLACGMPALVLAITTDLERLSHLYAIGVCGAITMNVLCCAWNRALPFSRATRNGMWAIGAVMLAIWLTISVTKLEATAFAGTLVAIVLAIRFAGQRLQAARDARALPEPELGWLAELRREPVRLDGSRPRIMLAARGRYQAEFAIDMARRRGATLFAIYVRTLRVIEMGAQRVPRVEDDPEAQEALGTVMLLARQYGVPCIPIYVSSPQIAEEILDYTVTYGCDTLIMGKTRRSMFARRVEGDVVSQVAQHLPDGVALITRDATPHPLGPPPAAAG